MIGSEPRGSTLAQWALIAIFVVPLGLGIWQNRLALRRTQQLSQLAREAASMYAQGVHFGEHANQDLIVRLGQGLDLDAAKGNTVVLLSKFCQNNEQPELKEQFVIGNSTLRAADRSGGPVSLPALKAGECAHVAETFFRAPELPAGIYARSLF